jgi:hypothetical protein
MKQPKNLEKMKEAESEIDRKIDDLISLRNHPSWSTFEECVRTIQLMLQREIFSQDFLKLDALQKDKQHHAIVLANSELERMLQLPEWLSKKKVSRWNDVQAHLMGGKNILKGDMNNVR